MFRTTTNIRVLARGTPLARATLGPAFRIRAASTQAVGGMGQGTEQSDSGIGKTHAKNDGEDSIVPKPIQKAVPESVERALPDSIHNTGDSKTHAKSGGKESVVPKKVQEAVPESVEKALPNSIHDTGNK